MVGAAPPAAHRLERARTSLAERGSGRRLWSLAAGSAPAARRLTGSATVATGRLGRPRPGLRRLDGSMARAGPLRGLDGVIGARLAACRRVGGDADRRVRCPARSGLRIAGAIRASAGAVPDGVSGARRRAARSLLLEIVRHLGHQLDLGPTAIVDIGPAGIDARQRGERDDQDRHLRQPALGQRRALVQVGLPVRSGDAAT